VGWFTLLCNQRLNSLDNLLCARGITFKSSSDERLSAVVCTLSCPLPGWPSPSWIWHVVTKHGSLKLFVSKKLHDSFHLTASCWRLTELEQQQFYVPARHNAGQARAPNHRRSSYTAQGWTLSRPRLTRWVDRWVPQHGFLWIITGWYGCDGGDLMVIVKLWWWNHGWWLIEMLYGYFHQFDKQARGLAVPNWCFTVIRISSAAVAEYQGDYAVRGRWSIVGWELTHGWLLVG